MIASMRRAIVVLLAAGAGCVAPKSEVPWNEQPVPTSQPDARGPRAVPPVGREIARSRDGRPIVIREFVSAAKPGVSPTVVLLFAGIHGNEGTTVYAAAELLKLLDANPTFVPPGVRLLIVPIANPDGYEARRRQNASGVDLNRNFPAANFKSSAKDKKYTPGTTPLSEPESRAIYDLVLREKPTRILALHSIKPPKHGVNFDGPADALAKLLASKNHYNVLPTMGYATPGSFGSWAGIDLQIPTITLEFPSNAPGPKAWADNRDALLAFIRGE